MTSVEAQPNIKAESPDDAGQQELDQTNVDSVAKIKDEPMSQSSSEGPANNNNNNNTDEDNNNDDADDSRDNNMNDDDDQYQDDGDHQNGIKNESMDENEKTNLIVNYLPQQMTDGEFEQLFTKFGNMKSCKIVRNRMTGYSYGFGFVDYDTHEQALNAIEELNGQEVDTKKIKVAFARPAGQDIKQANLYVKNVPNSWSQDDVKKVFEPYGQIIQVRVLGNNRGIAFVLFDLRKQAQDAMEALNGKQVDGCEEPFEIKFAADKKSEKRGNKTGGGAGAGSGSGTGADGDKPPRRRERGNRGGRNRDRNRHNNNMNQGRGTSQGRGFNNNNNNNNNGGGGRMFNRGGNNNNNNNSNNNSNNFNDNMNGGGVGPMRQQGNRMSRYAPFVPMQQAPMVQQAAPAPMNPYGFPQQPMMPYMMANHQAALMQMNPMAAAAHQQQQMHQMTNPYGAIGTMGATQMGAIGYAQPAMSQQQPSAAVSNMYNVASSMMNNAAQMQPQLGQPMSMRGAGGNSATNTNSNSGGAGGGGGGGSSDGVTLFVYNIGPDSDDNELKTMFSPYGDVLRCNVVRKTPGGETKGFGFVTVRNTSQANAAIAGLNGQVKNGKPLQVSFKK